MKRPVATPRPNAALRVRLPKLVLGPGMVLLLGMNGSLPFCNQQEVDPSLGNIHRLSDVVVVRPRANDPTTTIDPCGQFDPNCALSNEGTLGNACRDEGLCDTGLICDDSDTCVLAVVRTVDKVCVNTKSNTDIMLTTRDQCELVREV